MEALRATNAASPVPSPPVRERRFVKTIRAPAIPARMPVPCPSCCQAMSKPTTHTSTQHARANVAGVDARRSTGHEYGRDGHVPDDDGPPQASGVESGEVAGNEDRVHLRRPVSAVGVGGGVGGEQDGQGADETCHRVGGAASGLFRVPETDQREASDTCQRVDHRPGSPRDPTLQRSPHNHDAHVERQLAPAVGLHERWRDSAPPLPRPLTRQVACQQAHQGGPGQRSDADSERPGEHGPGQPRGAATRTHAVNARLLLWRDRPVGHDRCPPSTGRRLAV